MSRYPVNCKWCGDKPGGCLYCIDELADCDQEKLLLIDEAIRSGEVHVLAVRNTQEVLLRPVRRGRAGNPLPAGGAHGVARPTLPCMEHLWAHDAGNLKRRHCTRPGCKAVQGFVWLPASPDRNGEWVDADTVQKHSIPNPRNPRLKTAAKK